MIFKTATSLAFAAACLAAAATVPAQAQMAGTNGPQTYQGNTSPNWSGNAYGSPNWSAGTSGSTSGNYAPQSYQGNMAPPAAGMGGSEVVTNGPQASPGDMSSSWSARRNVVESQRYDRLLESNRGFRQARMRKECGPITDSGLRQQCLASFGQDEPYNGSSTSHRSYHSESGR
jgi:hypothetical protein